MGARSSSRRASTSTLESARRTLCSIQSSLTSIVSSHHKFDVVQIQVACPFLGQVVVKREVESTNDVARELASHPDQAMPTLVLAERQTAGRGRDGKAWWFGDGGLAMTLVVESSQWAEPSQSRSLLSLAVGCAVHGAVATILDQAEVTMKWPNDVYVNGKKVAGILIETVPGQATRLAIGIGINVNNAIELAPTEVRDGATSLAGVKGERLEIEAFLCNLLHELNHWVERGEGPMAAVNYADRNSEMKEGRVTIRSGKANFTGKYVGLSREGGLILESKGTPSVFHSGTITAIDKNRL